MAATRKPQGSSTRRPPATSPDSRENQLIAEAYDLAEKQLQEGTASAQTINFFLKRGSGRERLEMDRLRSENELLKARVEQLANSARTEQMYEEALRAMRQYSGQSIEGDDG